MVSLRISFSRDINIDENVGLFLSAHFVHPVKALGNKRCAYIKLCISPRSILRGEKEKPNKTIYSLPRHFDERPLCPT